MAPVVRISDETFAMLQRIAQPLVDTADSAIRRALAAYLASEGQQRQSTQLPRLGGEGESSLLGGTRFDPDCPPDLTHSSFLSGSVNGISVKKWNYLLIEAHSQALQALNGDLAALQRLSEAHIKKGKATASGFRYVPNFGFSIQGVESNKAWALSYKLAKKFGFPISIEFRWQEKQGAAFPGELGQLEWRP